MDQTKILNHKTNRYVKIDGKIGKLLLQERQERQERQNINGAPSHKASSIKNVSAINVSVKNVKAVKASVKASVKAVKAVKASIQNSMRSSSINSHVKMVNLPNNPKSNGTNEANGANEANEANEANDKLYFYSKSKDVAPGSGANEQVRKYTDYADLAKIKQWRQVLSNFHVCPFKFQGYTYNTIEHVFQAKKIELANPQKALWFTLESGHDIGKGDGGVAQKNRKLVTLDNSILSKWAMMRDNIMELAAIEKYKTCKEARD
jgi:predicted NAD-dependent protein-ADP-ribosyltransferase YbiA (DUF1768 family)